MSPVARPPLAPGAPSGTPQLTHRPVFCRANTLPEVRGFRCSGLRCAKWAARSHSCWQVSRQQSYGGKFFAVRYGRHLCTLRGAPATVCHASTWRTAALPASRARAGCARGVAAGRCARADGAHAARLGGALAIALGRGAAPPADAGTTTAGLVQSPPTRTVVAVASLQVCPGVSVLLRCCLFEMSCLAWSCRCARDPTRPRCSSGRDSCTRRTRRPYRRWSRWSPGARTSAAARARRPQERVDIEWQGELAALPAWRLRVPGSFAYLA